MNSDEKQTTAGSFSLSLSQTKWNPYMVGAGIGILSWLAFLVVNKPIGMSTEISKFSGWVVGLFSGMDNVSNNPYWASKTPAFGYSTVFLLFTAVGAFISAALGKDLSLEKVPDTWATYQGSSVAKRMIAAFFGGALLLFGARMGRRMHQWSRNQWNHATGCLQLDLFPGHVRLGHRYRNSALSRKILTPSFSYQSEIHNTMNLPISTSSTAGLIVAAVLGLIFGVLLNKGRVTDYNVIVNLFRFKDMTVMKIMLTAIVVGGVGVFLMNSAGLIEGYHIKDANIAGVVLGSAIFGVGMVLYGYCPGTAVAAVATGRLHALVGFFGMLAGGVVYAFSYGFVKAKILSIAAIGKVRLSEVTLVPDLVWWVLLIAGSIGAFHAIERHRTVDSKS